MSPPRDLCHAPVFAYTVRVLRWSRMACLLAVAWSVLVTVCPTLGATPPRAGGELDWRAGENKVSARISGWPLDRLLETVAARSRWQVFVDPEASHQVNAKFRDLPPGEALRRLLGPLNYALLPPASTNPAPRLYVFKNSRSAATLRIEAPANPGRARQLDDELILRVKPGSTNGVEELAARLGGRIVASSDALGAYRLKFDNAEAAEAARRTLAGDELTGGIDSNYVIERPDPAAAELNAALAGLSLKAKPVAAGDGLVVAVVDTAVQGDAAGIQDFLLSPISIAGKATPSGEELAHGTSMASTFLHGLAQLSGAEAGTTVRVLPVDVYGNNPEATSFDIALGIHAAIENGASIVNLSLGGAEPNGLIRDLIRAGRDRGVVFLAAAGNEPVTSPTFPAAYPEVVAVTALNRRGEVAPYANYGEFVDVGAPGASYVSFWGQPYMVVGTSPATASASAMAAWIASTQGRRGAELEQELRQALAVPRTELAP